MAKEEAALPLLGARSAITRLLAARSQPLVSNNSDRWLKAGTTLTTALTGMAQLGDDGAIITFAETPTHAARAGLPNPGMGPAIQAGSPATILGTPVAGNGRLTIPWTDGVTGAPIGARSYAIGKASSGETTLVPATIVNGNLVITGLTNGETYFILGYAHTSQGHSPASNEVSGTPMAAMLRGGVATNTDLMNQMDRTNAGHWSILRRERHYAKQAISTIQIMLPLWVVTGAGAIADLALAESYEFAAALEYPFTSATKGIPTNTRHRFTFNGANSFLYTVGGHTQPYVISDPLALGVTIPAGACFGSWVVHECVAGRSGPVTNKRIIKSQAGSANINRFEGQITVMTSLIAADGAMLSTSVSAISGAQTGALVPMGPGTFLTRHGAGVPSLLVDGNSIEAGNQEGYGASGTYGDATGDARGNRGWAMRLADRLGLNASNMSKGSDRDGHRLAPGAYTRRLATMAALNPTHYIDMNPHNDVPGGAGRYAANTAYALDSTFIANGNGYIVTQAGTSAAAGAGPAARGANIADGTMKATYIGPSDMNGASLGISWVGARRARLRLVQKALPSVTFIGTTLPPMSTSTRAVSAYAYDGGTGSMVLTMASVSDMVVGHTIRLSGLTPGPFNDSGTAPGSAITAVDTGNRTITVVKATGLAAPTGTAVVGTGFVSRDQTPASQVNVWTAGNSFRTWVNRFLRAQPNPVLPYTAIADLAKWTEWGGPVTAAAETGIWQAIPPGSPVAFAATSDTIHPTSRGYDNAAMRGAADAGLAAALRSVS